MSEQTSAAGLAEARRRAYTEDARPAVRPQMISFDLANGMTVTVARCCGDPQPHVAGPQWDKNTKSWHADLVCLTVDCGQTLAVLRWRLG